MRLQWRARKEKADLLRATRLLGQNALALETPASRIAAVTQARQPILGAACLVCGGETRKRAPQNRPIFFRCSSCNEKYYPVS